jgi:hypothetical protein
VAVSGVWHAPQGRDALVKVGDAYAAQPLNVEVLRLPASVFLPTFDLPWWAAAIQVAAVLGVAELLLGRPGLTVGLEHETALLVGILAAAVQARLRPRRAASAEQVVQS